MRMPHEDIVWGYHMGTEVARDDLRPPDPTTQTLRPNQVLPGTGTSASDLTWPIFAFLMECLPRHPSMGLISVFGFIYIYI